MLLIRTLLEGSAIHLLRVALLPIPVRWVPLAGEALGWFLFSVARLKRRLTLENLEAAFGDQYTPPQRKKLALRCYRHFGGIITEFVAMLRLGKLGLIEAVTLENVEVLDAALKEGKGVMLVSGHLGNWELMSAGVAARGYPFAMYVGQQHNPFADRFINTIRSRYGAHTIPKRGGGMRGMMRALKNNHVLGLLSDQHFSRNRHFVHFFGKTVSVAPGPGALAVRSRPALLFGDSYKVGRLRYAVRFHRLPLPPQKVGEEWGLLEVSQSISDAVEAAVRRHPEQYFWMHRRWRPIPPDRQPSEINREFLGKYSNGKKESTPRAT